MLSLHQAIEIKESILAYLKATFDFQDKEIAKAFEAFIAHPSEGMFKGPYLSLRLPFVKASKEEQGMIPLTITPKWQPYDHQIKAWKRLSTHLKPPKPTIVTTGTGSGKTEAFLYPLLDYCYQNRHRQGIKCIILYPMNALATDQASRLAEIIDQDERLRGNITAGLFIGEGKNTGSYPSTMGAKQLIENKEAILGSPPDILLTNFKMLDYALMKWNYQELWAFNKKEPDLLRFLVLDELHTYDGAQGTDVANLIRRLKLKLAMPTGHLCPVGTSATIGSGEEAPKLLSEYATKVFGEPVTEEAIITENRQKARLFFADDADLDNFLPRLKGLRETSLKPNEPLDDFLKRQLFLWSLNEQNLGESLQEFQIVKDLLQVCEEYQGIVDFTVLERELAMCNKRFRDIPIVEPDGFLPRRAVIESLVALIVMAKEKGENLPFLYLQVQLWIRELSGLQRSMTASPTFVWKDATEEGSPVKALPPWFCRECNASGWIAVKQDNKDRFETDIKDAYTKFFENHKNLHFVLPAQKFSLNDLTASGYKPDNAITRWVYNKSLDFVEEEGALEDCIQVLAVRKLRERDGSKVDHICPVCNTKNTVAIIGTRVATLNSIAVGQVLATDLDRQEEKGRKVLAFTNGVQDAAHQAGFIEARNYRFTLRASIQKVLLQQEGAVSLEQLADDFIAYWKAKSDSQSGMIGAYYYRFFPKDYLGKSSPSDYTDSTGAYSQRFQKEFDARIRWEVYNEFGFDALIGRTLEKTGTSAVYFDKAALYAVWLGIEKWWLEQEQTTPLEKGQFMAFVFLMLQRVRTRGSIHHEFLQKFREERYSLWDLNWSRDSSHFLNRFFGPRARLPKLLTAQYDARGILDSTYTKANNWYHDYFKKSFQGFSKHSDFINEFYATLITELSLAGILNEKEAGQQKSYVIHPSSLMVATEVHTLTCNSCGHKVHTADAMQSGIGGACLTFRCEGKYEGEDGVVQTNYYQAVYNRNRSPRVYAADHTGLLERKTRETLEHAFKTRPFFHSTNALVATSTLEMGIDIGSLNAVYNTAVPPLPSNFLQRIGRAGRKSGAALVLNFVQGKAHDLYYYREPLEMMAGNVNTPGCYLEAREILRRHFFAYCIDTWTGQNPSQHQIPSHIKYLKIAQLDLNDPLFFMNRLINFIKANEASLLQSFKSQYDSLPDKTFEAIEEQLQNDGFYQYYRHIFKQLKEEYLFLEAKKTTVQQHIKDLRLGEKDILLAEIKQDIKNIKGLMASIRQRTLLEYLTNVGALPNYAFPETGVVLNARVMGQALEGSDKAPLDKDFEIVRVASQAIKELAPENYFYSQGFRFKITGVNTFDWSDVANFHQKRFCSQCDHLEQEEIASKGNCPKCGHESWSSIANVHNFAKLTAVKSFNQRSEASLNDNKDERELVLYKLQHHFHFPQKTSAGAWALPESSFGIEFVKQTQITTLNLGKNHGGDANRLQINEQEAAKKGFVTCKHCGRSSSDTRELEGEKGKEYKFHYRYCKHRDRKYQGKEDEVFHELFFFRETTTEALKVLLPVQYVDSDAVIQMFKAGLSLGLRKYYKGNPQHIGMEVYREHNPRTLRFDRYLVLYDRVPGGTGYLQQLFQPKEFSKVLALAYENIRTCSCQHEGKDGCYHCIYSYTNQYQQEQLSRRIAENRFESLVESLEGWQYYPSGLSDVSGVGRIEESELEERFVRSLKNFCNKKNREWQFEERNEDGNISYTMQYQGSLGTWSYHIRPQVELGNNQGLAYYTRADFLITCTQATDVSTEEIPRMAIYLDGYQFHASEKHNRFANDVKKRLAIAQHPQYLSWTLTWQDLDQFDEYLLKPDKQRNRKDSLANKLDAHFSNTYTSVKKSIKKHRAVALEKAQNNMERLFCWLEQPAVTENGRFSWAMYLAFFQDRPFSPSYPYIAGEEALKQWEEAPEYCKQHKTFDGWIAFQGIKGNTVFEERSLVNVMQGTAYAQFCLKQTDTIDREDWNDFWAYFNIIQLFEVKEVAQFETATEETALWEMPAAELPDIAQLEEILVLYEPPYQQLVTALFHKGLIRTEADEDALSLLLLNGVVTEAQLIVAPIKWAFEPISEQDKQRLEEAGYYCAGKNELSKGYEELLKL